MFPRTFLQIFECAFPVFPEMMIETNYYMPGSNTGNKIIAYKPVIGNIGQMPVEWQDHQVVNALFFKQGNFFLQ